MMIFRKAAINFLFCVMAFSVQAQQSLTRQYLPISKATMSQLDFTSKSVVFLGI